jgi:uncharacterized membrane protein YphA (DoxX/SURF4 family)
MSFTLGELLFWVGVFAVGITAGMLFLAKDRIKNLPISFLQNYVGVLFLVSGAVKAIDPLGTAYKMEQYFAEFEATFSGTWLDFMAGLFPKLAEVSIGFSVFMIVFELVLAIMLILGTRLKATSISFLVLVVFFTVLTGFTYLTAYVPSGVNFFDFANWGAFKETNMRVTDCGCFGDFIKLKPFTSFLKDIFLLIPGVIFIFGRNQMHQIGSKKLRTVLSFGSIPILLIYCFSNYVWDIPGVDFRPFSIGKDVRTTKEIEMEAQASVQVTGYILTKKDDSGKTVETAEMSMDQYLKDYQKYPKAEGWSAEQITSKPEIEATKISDFEVQTVDGNDATDNILFQEGYSIMLVAHKLKFETAQEQITVNDTITKLDTIQVNPDSIFIEESIVEILQKQETVNTYSWPESYLSAYKEVASPFVKAAQAAGIPCYEVVGLTDGAMLEAFKKEVDLDIPFYMADDILLKTIVRSNPGFVLWKDGKIVYKWHHNKLPDFEEVKSNFIK